MGLEEIRLQGQWPIYLEFHKHVHKNLSRQSKVNGKLLNILFTFHACNVNIKLGYWYCVTDMSILR